MSGHFGAAREEVVFIDGERGIDVITRCNDCASELRAIVHGKVGPFACEGDIKCAASPRRVRPRARFQ